ncbi:MAG: DUF6796 family protein, partial [Ruminiclostridium sp.]
MMMSTELIFSILGLAGGVLCGAADIFFDLKGRDNKKSGKYGFIHSKWTEMSEWRFPLSIILVMFAVPMYALGIISLGNQIGGVTGFVMKFSAIVGPMGGFFIHIVLCLFPVIYKTIPDKQLGEKVINKIYETIKFPFYLLYIILILAPTVCTEIAIFTGMIDVPIVCAFLNPFVFLIIGVLLRKINYNFFYDLPGICM